MDEFELIKNAKILYNFDIPLTTETVQLVRYALHCGYSKGFSECSAEKCQIITKKSTSTRIKNQLKKAFWFMRLQKKQTNDMFPKKQTNTFLLKLQSKITEVSKIL